VSRGTLNLDGQAVIRASLVAEESALHHILAPIARAEQQKAPAQKVHRFLQSLLHMDRTGWERVTVRRSAVDAEAIRHGFLS
jgi:hypothetical protein